MLPGETIATLAEDRYILRLQLPERHARFMRAGDVVQIGARGLEDTGEGARAACASSIPRSRAAGSSPTSRFRASATISSASARASMSAPARAGRSSCRAAYVYRRAGVNYVKLADGAEVVVQPGEPQAPPTSRSSPA